MSMPVSMERKWVFLFGNPQQIKHIKSLPLTKWSFFLSSTHFFTVTFFSLLSSDRFFSPFLFTWILILKVVMEMFLHFSFYIHGARFLSNSSEDDRFFQHFIGLVKVFVPLSQVLRFRGLCFYLFIFVTLNI